MRPMGLVCCGGALLLALAALVGAAAEERGIAIAPGASTPAIYRNSWAVVVGVDRFRDRRVSPLGYAVNDAKAVARVVAGLGFRPDHVILLLNEDASRAAIERTLSGVVRRATRPDDRLFVFFATHGVTSALPHGGEEGYLLPHDADLDDLPLTAISMQQIKQIGQRIPARHVLVAVDACYGGFTLVRSQAPPVVDERYLELVLRSRAIQVMAAGRRDQPVIEEGGHGVFTRTLLTGLAGHADENGDGLITASELGAWMHPRVAQASDYKQDMQWGSLDGEGQFVFVLPTTPRAVPATAPRGPRPSPAVTPPPPAAPVPTPPADVRVGAVPPSSPPVVAPLGPLLGTWHGVMSTRLSEGVVELTVSSAGNRVEAVLLLQSARPLGSGAAGLQESYDLGRHVGRRPLTTLALSGDHFQAHDAAQVFSVETELARDRRSMTGSIFVAGQSYHVHFWRR